MTFGEQLVEARRALLDALEALQEQSGALVLVGAQAVYIHTGDADVAIATETKDSDIAVIPDALSPEPRLEEAMKRSGFQPNLTTNDPGAWLSRHGVPVDLLVPEALAGAPARRAVDIPPHDRRAARRVRGLEAAVVDNEVRTIEALEPEDTRSVAVRVAGPAALLTAKLHKLGERAEDGARLNDKDAHDVYRLLRVAEPRELAETVRRLQSEPVSAEVTTKAMAYLESLFRSADATGSRMAGRAEERLGDPEFVAAAVAVLVSDLLDALAP
jgi:Nucleotidyltransferase